MEMTKTENIKLTALGGVGELGNNMYLVELDEDMFIVDSGCMVPGSELFGIDMVIPDITYLAENKRNVRGIFLTDGHEENMGGLVHVIRRLDVPVYGTKFTLELVKEKLKGTGVGNKIQFHVVDSETELVFERARVSFFRTNHDIPGSIGVCFHTSQGAIVHTGDFKLDQTLTGPYGADIGKMASIGEEGVLCLLSDSQNAEQPGYSKSEAEAGTEIQTMFRRASGRIVICAYSTNINRIKQIFDAASVTGRKVALLGKGTPSVLKLASNLGYIEFDEEMIISLADLEKYPDHQVSILLTGGLTDILNSLTRMARNHYKQLQVKDGDTVLLSFTAPPGNELAVSKAVDALFRAKANVLFGKKQFQAAGHASQEELKFMLNLMKPKYFVAVRGDYKMQKAHARVAESAGILRENIFTPDKGESIEFRNEKVRTGSKIYAGNVLIDGLGVGDIGNIVLRDRRLLSQDGIFIVVITLHKKTKQIVAGPEVISRGFVYIRESEKLLEESSKLVGGIVESNLQGQAIDWATLKQNIRDALNQYLYERTKRRPIILPIIMEV